MCQNWILLTYCIKLGIKWQQFCVFNGRTLYGSRACFVYPSQTVITFPQNTSILLGIYVLYSTLLHLLALRFHWARGFGIESRTVATLQSGALTTYRLDLIQTRLYLIHTRIDLTNRLDLIHTRLDLIHLRLDLIHTLLDLVHTRQDLTHTRLDLIHTRPDLIHYLTRTHPHKARSHPHSARSHSLLG